MGWSDDFKDYYELYERKGKFSRWDNRTWIADTLAGYLSGSLYVCRAVIREIGNSLRGL
jgi:hypothetical protein